MGQGACCGRDALEFDFPRGRLPTSSPSSPGGRRGYSQNFVHQNPGKISDFYVLTKEALGQGSFGSVRKARSRCTGLDRAIKTVRKAGAASNIVESEEQVMKLVDHPNIIKLFEQFEDRKNVYLVLELCKGGDLFEQIIEEGHFTERKAAEVVEQMLHAVFYLHTKAIAHRDLKPENFLFLTKGPIEGNTMKLVDFGFAREFSDRPLSTTCGTPYYVDPNVLKGVYDESCDEWSCGVLMYVMLCGYPPWSAPTDGEILSLVEKAELDFPPDEWERTSEEAKELIRSLLRVDTKERLRAERALEHSWVRQRAASARELQPAAAGGGAAPLSHLVDNLKSFRSARKFKKAALEVIAKQASDGQIKALHDAFTALDHAGAGVLSIAELKEGLHKAGLVQSCADLEDVLRGIDADGNGQIGYSEWIAATLDKKTYMQEDLCRAAFSVFDMNGDGAISKDELKRVLCDPAVNALMGDTSDVDSLFHEADANGDGSIDINEFMNMLREGGSTPRGNGSRTPSRRSSNGSLTNGTCTPRLGGLPEDCCEHEASVLSLAFTPATTIWSRRKKVKRLSWSSIPEGDLLLDEEEGPNSVL